MKRRFNVDIVVKIALGCALLLPVAGVLTGPTLPPSVQLLGHGLLAMGLLGIIAAGCTMAVLAFKSAYGRRRR